MAGHRVAGAQIEALDLRRRDVDVVRAVEVVPVLAAKKAVALGQDLEHALAGERDLLIEQFLLDLKNEILLPQTARIFNGVPFSHVLELRN